MGKERALRCPKCGNVIYPRINPAVIVGVTNGDKLLLTKYKTGYGSNALVAGFTKIGETLEETVAKAASAEDQKIRQLSRLLTAISPENCSWKRPMNQRQ